MTLRTYVDVRVMQGMLDRFSREGPTGLAAAIDARLRTSPGDEVILLADPSSSPMTVAVTAERASRGAATTTPTCSRLIVSEEEDDVAQASRQRGEWR
ncbi:MAG TPA: hypothetical protein VK548_02295 [Candidatus Acidoferrum sp.]|nr:hypothetical protein [Candidatus Acidoferrum sp.]